VLFATYRAQWPRIGAVIATLIGAATVAARARMTKPQILSAANLMALMAHQYEEYVQPGYFPGQFNRGLFNSDSPRNYPLNPQTAMVINTALAYPFYLAPVLFPAKRWLGLAPVLVGWSQIVLHGIVIPAKAGAKYGPGIVTALLLHLPIGIGYLKAVDQPISKRDWATGSIGAVVSALFGVIVPNMLMRDRNSPYAFTPKQLGRYDTESSLRDSTVANVWVSPGQRADT
jgi:Protein of unknown function with HXXEE motif